MAEQAFSVQVAVMGGQKREIQIPAGEEWSVAKVLAEAGITRNREDSVSVNGTVLDDLNTAVTPQAQGGLVIVLVNPRVNNGLSAN